METKKDILGLFTLLGASLQEAATEYNCTRGEFASREALEHWIASMRGGNFTATIYRLSEIGEPASGGSLIGVSLYIGIENKDRNLEGLKESLQGIQDVFDSFLENLQGKAGELTGMGFMLPERPRLRTLPPIQGWRYSWARIDVATADTNYSGTADNWEGFITFDDEIFMTAAEGMLRVKKV